MCSTEVSLESNSVIHNSASKILPKQTQYSPCRSGKMALPSNYKQVAMAMQSSSSPSRESLENHAYRHHRPCTILFYILYTALLHVEPRLPYTPPSDPHQCIQTISLSLCKICMNGVTPDSMSLHQRMRISASCLIQLP